MTLNVNAGYGDVLRIKECREAAAETKLMQAGRKLQDAISEEETANRQLQDWTSKCAVREQELYEKLLSGGAVKLNDIDRVKFEIEGMRNDLKRKQEYLKSVEGRREKAEHARNDARKAYQEAARSREKTALVLRAQKEEQQLLKIRQADDEIDEFSEQASLKRRATMTGFVSGDGS